MKDNPADSSRKRRYSPSSYEMLATAALPSQYYTGLYWEKRQLVLLDKGKIFECLGYFEAEKFKTFTDASDLRLTQENFTCPSLWSLKESDISIDWSRKLFTIDAKIREFLSPVSVEEATLIDAGVTESAAQIAGEKINHIFAELAEEEVARQKQSKTTAGAATHSAASVTSLVHSVETPSASTVSGVSGSAGGEDPEKDHELDSLMIDDSWEEEPSSTP